MFLTLLSTPPGSWFYTLALLAALEAPVVLALHRFWTLRTTAATRAALAVTALFGLRILALLGVLLVPADTPEALVVGPPLDRAVGLLGGLGLAWALAYPQPRARADLGVLGTALATGVALVFTWDVWARAVTTGATYFNGSRPESAWTVATLAVLAWGLYALNRQRPPGWMAGLGVLGLLFIGYGGHYLFPVAGTNAAGLARWAELVGLPVGAVLLYRRAATLETAGDATPRTDARAPARKAPPLWRSLAETLLLTLVIYSALEFATGRFRVNGPSMQPNLHTGQFVLADRLVYYLGAPQRGDVVVVHPPPEPDEAFIKRVIGLPGETVEIRAGVVRVNGHALTEPYIAAPPNYSGTWELGDDEYLVLGDNRINSSDSHIWGPVSQRAILGRALLVYWPLAEAGFIEHVRER